MANFTEEINYLKLHEDAIDFNINRPLQELLDNTVYNKETWEAWLNDPILNNRLQLNASMTVDGDMDVNDTLIGNNINVDGDVYTDNLNVESLIDDGKHPLEETFPIGSVYINSSNGANPSVLLGFGTWEKFAKGRALIGVGSDEYSSVRATGGEKEVQLLEEHLPSHSHELETITEERDRHRHQYTTSDGDSTHSGHGFASCYGIKKTSLKDGQTTPATSSHNHDIAMEEVGGDESHNNMQPYVTVYIWRRVG